MLRTVAARRHGIDDTRSADDGTPTLRRAYVAAPSPRSGVHSRPRRYRAGRAGGAIDFRVGASSIHYSRMVGLAHGQHSQRERRVRPARCSRSASAAPPECRSTADVPVAPRGAFRRSRRWQRLTIVQGYREARPSIAPEVLRGGQGATLAALRDGSSADRSWRKAGPITRASNPALQVLYCDPFGG